MSKIITISNLVDKVKYIDSLHKAWMEVSEGAEVFIMKSCEGEKFLIHYSQIACIMQNKATPSPDGYHYQRNIVGISKEKIALGTLSFSNEGKQ